MLTMFDMTYAPGAWGRIGRKVIFEVSGFYCVFFIAYVCGVTFGLIRVVSALFLKETLTAAANDEECAIADRRKRRENDVAHLRMVFDIVDKDHSESITVEEFEACIDD